MLARAGIRRTAFTIGAALCIAAGQEPADSTLQFEVASIRPHTRGVPRATITEPEQVRLQYYSAGTLIEFAFGVESAFMEGRPDWLFAEYFDVVAKPPRPSTVPEERIMLQNLLAERFGLRHHTESDPQGRVYNLVVGKELKLRLGSGEKELRLVPRVGQNASDIVAHNVTMAELADQLSGWVGRRVFDKTGLSGTFDFSVTWEPDPEVTPDGKQMYRYGPRTYIAAIEMTGLRLVDARGPVEKFVIEAIDRPTQN